MTWIILDAAALAVLVLFVAVGRRRGFLAMALLLIGTLAAFMVARQYAQPAAQWAYDNYGRAWLVDYVDQKLEELPDSGDVGALAGVLTELTEEVDLLAEFDQLKGKAEGFLQNIKEFTASQSGETITYPEGIDPSVQQQGLIEQLMQEGCTLSEALVEVILQPLALSLLEAIAFLLIFIGVNLLVKLLIRASRLFNKVPLVGGVNRFFGGVCGLLEGLVVLYVIGIILRMGAAAAGPDSFITTQLLQQTRLLSPIIYFLN